MLSNSNLVFIIFWILCPSRAMSHNMYGSTIFKGNYIQKNGCSFLFQYFTGMLMKNMEGIEATQFL